MVQAGANRVQTTRRERDPRQAINFRTDRGQTRQENRQKSRQGNQTMKTSVGGNALQVTRVM